ncbi:hypothetical protein [Streptosporangium sp. NPDC002721]|uniref:hypothetical protein n=1 Tax=Streptosporangium sp. NPDC002721 TaxID=3366188 RepID=UPI0036AAF3E8
MSAVKRIARLAAALGVATALGVGLAATPAQADDIPGVLTARLTITKEAAGCRVLTFGKVGMTQAQAQYLVDNGARAQVEIWGEEAVYDNRLYRAGDAQLSVGSDRNGGGLIILSVPTIRCSLLDEDDSSFEGAGDEVYAKVILTAPGYSRMTKRTNTVHGRY